MWCSPRRLRPPVPVRVGDPLDGRDGTQSGARAAPAPCRPAASPRPPAVRPPAQAETQLANAEPERLRIRDRYLSARRKNRCGRTGTRSIAPGAAGRPENAFFGAAAPTGRTTVPALWRAARKGLPRTVCDGRQPEEWGKKQHSDNLFSMTLTLGVCVCVCVFMTPQNPHTADAHPLLDCCSCCSGSSALRSASSSSGGCWTAGQPPSRQLRPGCRLIGLPVHEPPTLRERRPFWATAAKTPARLVGSWPDLVAEAGAARSRAVGPPGRGSPRLPAGRLCPRVRRVR